MPLQDYEREVIYVWKNNKQNLPILPAIIDLVAIEAITFDLDGTKELKAAICKASAPKLLKPHRAYVEIRTLLS